MSGVLKLGGVTVATETDGAVSLDSTLISNISMSANHAGVKTALNASGDAPVYACRAWVNFDGTNTNSTFTEANGGIRDSGNVTSVTNTTTGRFTINFDIDMPHANYSVAAIAQRNATYSADSNTIIVGLEMDTSSSLSTTGFDITTHYHTNAAQQNPLVVCLAVFC